MPRRYHLCRRVFAPRRPMYQDAGGVWRVPHSHRRIRNRACQRRSKPQGYPCQAIRGSGGHMMHGINSFYYVFSRAIADLQRSSPEFNSLVRTLITPPASSYILLGGSLEGGMLVLAVSLLSTGNPALCRAPGHVWIRATKRNAAIFETAWAAAGMMFGPWSNLSA